MFEDQTIHIQLWDTSGQEDYKKLRPLSYPQTNVFIIAFSLISPLSLEKVETEFLPEIEEHCPGVPYILVGTMNSLNMQMNTKKKDGIQYQRKKAKN